MSKSIIIQGGRTMTYYEDGKPQNLTFEHAIKRDLEARTKVLKKITAIQFYKKITYYKKNKDLNFVLF